MQIVYVSSLTEKEKMKSIILNSKKKPLQSIQKFHRLICEGLVLNKLKVTTISAIPMSRKISNKKIWFEKKQLINGVKYNYTPFINFPIVRQIFILFSTIIMTIKESRKMKKEKIFICDVLNTTMATTVLILSKLLKFTCVGIVTDLPRDIGGKHSISKKINEKLQSKYDAYILLTEAMNDIVNPNSKPYIVIEGIADIEMKMIDNKIENKYDEKVCLYAGGLYEKYGVKNLVEAFKLIENKNIRLYIYGNGELEEYLRNIQDYRIKYFGVVSNDEIIKQEIKSTLLINPRFTNEEYTKYSFPSKNIEYMSSGTPIITTKLPGMPKEYYNYIYCFENESIEGMKITLERILNLEKKELYRKGFFQKEFILKNKNNKMQAEKILKFLTLIQGGKR